MASIFRNGKYWRAQVRKTGYPTKTRTFDTKAEAITWAAQVESSLAAQTINREERLIRWWCESPWADTPLTQVSGPQTAQAVQFMTTDELWSAQSIRLALAVLSHLYTIARKEWGYTELVRKPGIPGHLSGYRAPAAGRIREKRPAAQPRSGTVGL